MAVNVCDYIPVNTVAAGPRLHKGRDVLTHRVVVTDLTESGNDIELEIFANSGLPIELVTAEETGRAGLLAATAGAHALMVQFAKIDRALIESLTSCRVIARYGVGVDMVDINAATDMGIPVANVPHFCIDEVSSQTIGFVLDLNRRTLPLAAHVRAGRWGTMPPITPPSRLRGQVLGVVGFGAIGSEVARKAQAFGLEVVAYDPFAVPDRHPGMSFVPLPQLLAQSDYVTLHCPLTDATRGLIGAAELAQMKRSAYLLNLSRGPVVDQAALTEALRTGVILGAALDVLTTEPPDPTDPLLQLDNVIVTPHIASWSIEAGVELRREVAQSVVHALQGREPASVVNRSQLLARAPT
jgi:D-3-phosphoglycerate dehydrogenase / 2-oxoglutarate reductase